MASSQDAWYLSLLGLAEHFLSKSLPDVRSCVQCLQAIFSFNPPPRVEARTHLQLGNVLLTYTHNTDLAQQHLEKAWELSQNINSYDDVKFEAISVLAQLFEEQHQTDRSMDGLRRAIEISQSNCYWHCRLLFQLAQLHARERDYVSACSLLGVGVDFTGISGASYTQVLFLLSKIMLLMCDRKMADASTNFAHASSLVDTWQSNSQQKEYIKVFFLILKTCYYLISGQVKYSKSWLKELQQSVQELSQWNQSESHPVCTGAGDKFMWLSRDVLCVIVYVITVMYSMLSGYMHKAIKYSEKALSQIDSVAKESDNFLLKCFRLMVIEHIVQCRLVMGDRCGAILQIGRHLQISRSDATLSNMHRAQFHTLLGLYAMSMNCLDAAETQLCYVLSSCQDAELHMFATLNLALVYIQCSNSAQFTNCVSRIQQDTLANKSYCLRASLYYVQGFHGYSQLMFTEAKRYLRETLKMANSEDLNRLTSCSLVLLGNIFLSLGNHGDSFNMVTPAMQLANKIPDVSIQLWSSTLLRNLYSVSGDALKQNAEAEKCANFTQNMCRDQWSASQTLEHQHLLCLPSDTPAPDITTPPSSN